MKQLLTAQRARFLSVLLMLTAACLWACDDQVAAPEAPSGTTVQEPIGDVLGIDHPAVELPPASRGVKRLTVDQIRSSLAILGGSDAAGKPTQWTIEYEGKTYNALDDAILGFTLGKPDYVQITEEITEPNALYLKFMDDMARFVCNSMITADASKPQSERVLTRFVADPEDTEDVDAIDENLRYLALRLLAERIPADSADEPRLVALRTLFSAVAQAEAGAPSGTMGWRSVCVGIFTSPEFHLY